MAWARRASARAVGETPYTIRRGAGRTGWMWISTLPPL